MKRRDEVLVGMVTLVALVMGFIGALWLARGGLAPGYPLNAKFAWGAGLRQGQPVLLAGVTVGYVDNVDIQPDGYLIIAMRVRNNYKVPKGTTATIEPNGFFGDMLVALHPDKPNPQNYQPGDTIPAGKPSPSISDVLLRVDTLVANLSSLAGGLKKNLIDDNGMKDLRAAVTSARNMFATLDRVASEQGEELKKTQAALRKATTAIDSAQIDSTLKSIQETGAAVKDLSASLRGTSNHLDSLLNRATTGSGSFAKLMNEPTLHDDLSKSLRRLDSLMTEFQKNPRKFIKLSIF
jgi:phospholipid/cholesterol/gamma-HCH transport system substrate-binding protein